MSDAPLAAASVDPTSLVANGAALAFDGPFDMALAALELVRFERAPHESVFESAPRSDWGRETIGAPTPAVPSGMSLDFVFGADPGTGFHVAADALRFQGWADVAIHADPSAALVDVGFAALSGDHAPATPIDVPAHAEFIGIGEGPDIADLVIDALQSPELSWLVAGPGGDGTHLRDTWAWDTDRGAFVFHHLG